MRTTLQAKRHGLRRGRTPGASCGGEGPSGRGGASFMIITPDGRLGDGGA
ncbi:MAG TPA: hypothetical protein VF590_21435 [Isosphaeraceae bacterium]